MDDQNQDSDEDAEIQSILQGPHSFPRITIEELTTSLICTPSPDFGSPITMEELALFRAQFHQNRMPSGNSLPDFGSPITREELLLLGAQTQPTNQNRIPDRLDLSSLDLGPEITNEELNSLRREDPYIFHTIPSSINTVGGQLPRSTIQQYQPIVRPASPVAGIGKKTNTMADQQKTFKFITRGETVSPEIITPNERTYTYNNETCIRENSAGRSKLPKFFVHTPKSYAPTFKRREETNKKNAFKIAKLKAKKKRELESSNVGSASDSTVPTEQDKN